MKYFLSIIAIILSVSCQHSNNEIVELKYLYNDPTFKEYNFLVFNDKDSNYIFIISDYSNDDSTINNNYEMLNKNDFYELKIIPINETMIMENIIRGYYQSEIRTCEPDNMLITRNDTLVCKAYRSPNVVGLYYVKTE